MIHDNLSDEAAVLFANARAEEVMEAQFIDHLNNVAAKNGKKEADAALQDAQIQQVSEFEAAVRQKAARDNQVRAKQNRRFWLLIRIAAIAAIFPLASLAVMLGALCSDTAAVAMCGGLYLMGVFSCMTVQEFWPRHKCLR